MLISEAVRTLASICLISHIKWFQAVSVSGLALSFPYIFLWGRGWEEMDVNMLTFILYLTIAAMYQAAGETGKKVQTCLWRLTLFETKPS